MSVKTLGPTLGWAAYLAVSWTWCIGMFFPVLLVRDYGIWGFVVFAVPNVVGAAAMGWVLCRDGMSEHLVHRHRHAMVAFSAVTAAFHGYWISWLAASTGFPVLPYAVILPIALLVFACITKTLSRPERTHAIWISCGSVLIVSLIAVGVLGIADQVAVPELNEATAAQPALFLLLPCLLGFALCPYLDLSFHHARQMLGSRLARWGFTLGFGVFFLSMILITLGYSKVLPIWMQGTIDGVSDWVVYAFVVHIVLQTVMTLGIHAQRVTRLQSSPNPVLFISSIIAGVVMYLLAVLPSIWGIEQVADMSIGELIYRCFMVFYGLVFPAYVWLCMLPTRDGHSGIKGRDGRRNRLVLSAVIGLAVPLYWMGFIERQEPWLIGGVAIVLLGRLFVGRSGMSEAVRAGRSPNADLSP